MFTMTYEYAQLPRSSRAVFVVPDTTSDVGKIPQAVPTSNAVDSDSGVRVNQGLSRRCFALRSKLEPLRAVSMVAVLRTVVTRSIPSTNLSALPANRLTLPACLPSPATPFLEVCSALAPTPPCLLPNQLPPPGSPTPTKTATPHPPRTLRREEVVFQQHQQPRQRTLACSRRQAQRQSLQRHCRRLAL